MKIQAYANGDVIDMDDDTARTLIDAGIYAAVKEPTKPEPPKKPAPKKSPDKSTDRPTKVEPMTTEDMPTVPNKQVA